MDNFELGRVKCESWIDQHDTSAEQRKNMSPWQETNPWPPEHNRASARFSGGRGFNSSLGLRVFLFPTLILCWSIHLSWTKLFYSLEERYGRRVYIWKIHTICIMWTSTVYRKYQGCSCSLVYECYACKRADSFEIVKCTEHYNWL